MTRATFTLAALLVGNLAFGATIDGERSVFTWTGSKITGSKHFGNLSPVSSNIAVISGELTGWLNWRAKFKSSSKKKKPLQTKWKS